MPWRWEPIKRSANKNPPDWNDCNSNLSFLVLNKSTKYGETVGHWRGTFRIGKHDSISPRHYPQESCGRVVLEQRHSWRPPIIQDFQPWLSVVKMVDTPHEKNILRINRLNMLPSTSYLCCSYWTLECCLTVLSSCLPIASAKELIASCSAEKRPQVLSHFHNRVSWSLLWKVIPMMLPYWRSAIEGKPSVYLSNLVNFNRLPFHAACTKFTRLILFQGDQVWTKWTLKHISPV